MNAIALILEYANIRSQYFCLGIALQTQPLAYVQALLHYGVKLSQCLERKCNILLLELAMDRPDTIISKLLLDAVLHPR